MKRREFLGGALCTIAGAAEPASSVKRVLAMFKCHFDLGFIDTQAGVMRRYFEQFYPRAIQIAESLRQSGQDRYVWTTGSWLLYEYLEQAAPADRKRMEQAVREGSIAWHALPFSWQTELMDQTMIAGCLGLSQTLDRRFGRKTTGAKMTDVPGHTRGLIAPLAANGVAFLDIGVNSASTPPEVPELFVWKDAAGHSLVMMYHHKAYGGVVRVPGSDLAISINMADDNAGPHSPEEIHKIYADLRRQFPHAAIQAANLTDIANAVVPYRAHFPTVTQEIGDTWIYGVPSDPLKLARYREIARLRRGWIAAGKWKTGDPADVAFLRRFSLAVEHTWGTDTKTWLDFNHYKPRDLTPMLGDPKYQTVQKSWVEKRKDIDDAVAGLPAAQSKEVRLRLAALQPARPEPGAMQRLRAGDVLETAHFRIGLDPKTGAITTFRSKSNGRDWASAAHPLALFAYQTLSKADYDRFLDSYVTSKADWAPKDFGKPNIDHFGAKSQTWLPTLVNTWGGREASRYRLLAQLKIQDEASLKSGVTAWPDDMYLEIVLPDAEPAAHVNFSWFGKAANRLPEALWLTCQPDAPETKNWMLDKSGEAVSPFDVVRGGNRHMHALGTGLSYHDSRGRLELQTLDAPVVVLGERSPIAFSKEQPDLKQGFHFSLFNNAWGTNYVQWFGEDMRFRFSIKA